MTQVQTEALGRARGGQSFTNYPAIFRGFLKMGIPEADIRPRENVLTYHAWRAVGRQVKKGEHGVRIVTWIPCKEMVDAVTFTGAAFKKRIENLRPKTAVVFHESQTEEAGTVLA